MEEDPHAQLRRTRASDGGAARPATTLCTPAMHMHQKSVQRGYLDRDLCSRTMHLQLPRTPSSDDRHHQPAPTRPPLLSPSTPRRSLSLSRTPAHACMPRAPNLCDAPPLLLHGTAASLTDDSPSLQRPLAGLRGSAETEMGLDAVRHALSTYDDPPVRLRVSRLSDLSSTVLLIRRPSHTILARMARGGRPGRGCAGGRSSSVHCAARLSLHSLPHSPRP